ncbi:MAG TPA: acyl carrier protein [Thermoanaerobaculia bacterium]|jgi:acyl carrier protein|nr:acyl carrier protein [Thermoanaerobaculia bacterium]
MIEDVKRWLLERKPEIGDLDPDFDLIDNRVIDSLSFLDFVFFLEELTGRELQATAETVHYFRTLRAIEGNILHA